MEEMARGKIMETQRRNERGRKRTMEENMRRLFTGS
jgi:hypothetical protein